MAGKAAAGLEAAGALLPAERDDPAAPPTPAEDNAGEGLDGNGAALAAASVSRLQVAFIGAKVSSP